MCRCMKMRLFSVLFTHFLVATSDSEGMISLSAFVWFVPSMYMKCFRIDIPENFFTFFRGRSGLNSERYVYEKQRYDGWFNNMAHPEWGSIGEETQYNTK